jgi:hypothetical protein
MPVAAEIAAVGIVGDCPNSAAVVVDAADPGWGIHHVVLGRSTTRTTTASGSRHHLFPLLLVNIGNVLHHSLLINGRTCQLIVRQAGELYQALL